MSVSHVRSLEKGIDVVLLVADRPQGLSLSEVATTLSLPESTAYRLLVTLQNRAFIHRDPLTRKYRLHASLLRLEASISAGLDIIRLAHDHLSELSDHSGETSQLYVVQGPEVVLADARESRNTVRYMVEKGCSEPLYAAASGRAILAFLPDDHVARYLQQTELRSFTPHTVTDPERLRGILAHTRASGFAISFQQVLMGIRAVFAPVFDHRRHPIASLGVGGPDPRFTEEKAGEVGAACREHAQKLSLALGCSASERHHS